MDVFGKVIAAILIAVFVFLYPLKYIQEDHTTACEDYIEAKVTTFVDRVCESGSIGVLEYQKLREDIHRLNQSYEITIQQIHPVRTIECMKQKEVQTCSLVVPLDERGKSIHGTIQTSEIVKNQENLILKEIKPDIERVELNRYEEINVTSVTLIYENGEENVVTSGFKITGFDNTVLGEQNVTISYTEQGVTQSVCVPITVLPLNRVCEVCGFDYAMDENDMDGGCPNCNHTLVGIKTKETYYEILKGEALKIDVYGVYKDGHTTRLEGWSSDYDSTAIGGQVITINYKEFETSVAIHVVGKKTCKTCGKEYDLDCDGTDEGCTTCEQELICIVASPSHQNVNYGEDIKITVVGTYRDGHQETIKNWTCDYDARRIGEQTVTVLYEKIKTEIMVTVKRDDTIMKCSVCGKTYDMVEHQRGCPECVKQIDHIEALLENGDAKINVGGELKVKIILYYRDGHSEIKTSGFKITGYDRTRLGKQRIIVEYETYQCNLDVVVVDRMETKICPKGHVYYLMEDGSDMGCPYCKETKKEQVIEYFDITYDTNITQKLYQNNGYEIPNGDYICVKVTKKSDHTKARYLLFGSTSNYEYTYGNEVRK